ncbi:MAG: matrixin family metalloprotease, partial [Planctomycetota bacterium]|nr:matrixin family metalloprotease [Planctomycetota bacterium]
SDAEANDNTDADLNFPGASGAVLAIWKACVEWSSELHGDGGGDPHQPFDIGSGGANFDPSFQGQADIIGNTNANIISQIDSYGGGTLAYTELPIADGWRIRFFQDPTVWHDGPGEIIGGSEHADIQGIATHEFGHALGLGHSTVAGATMATLSSNHYIPMRSIEPDDQAGIQYLYGVKATDKPHIETYTLSGDTLTISGANFDTVGNEVWFTPAAPGGDGTPLAVSGLASSGGGTSLSVTIPNAAGPGDLLVKRAGLDHAALSNPFPFDPAREPCASPSAYGAAKTTSFGSTPILSARGYGSAVTDDLVLDVYNGTMNGWGVLFSGPAPMSLPLFGGTVHVAPPFVRETLFQFNFVGIAELPVPVDAALLGTTRYYQVWFEDPGDTFGVGLTNGLEVQFCP